MKIGRAPGRPAARPLPTGPLRPAAGRTSALRVHLRPATAVLPLMPPAPTPSWRVGGTSAGHEGGAHQPLPTDRTALRIRFRPWTAIGRPIRRAGSLYDVLSQLLSTIGQRFGVGVGIQAPTAHQHGPPRGYMAQPAPHALLDWQAHRPLCRLAAWAFGPLFIPTDDPRAITRDQPMGSEGASAPGRSEPPVHRDSAPG